MIYLSGDIETNPGPITNYAHGFKICHWNLNSIATDNFVKIPLLEAYAITHNFDIVCLSETFLYSSYSNDDPRLQLSLYVQTILWVQNVEGFVFITKSAFL